MAARPQDYAQDIASIREWLAKERHLPTNFDDLMLSKFIHSCYGSLEKTKKCIERFCSTRTEMSEVYTKRDPLQKNLQTAFKITSVVTYKVNDDQEMLIHQLDDPGLENLVFYDLIKTFALQADYWLKEYDFLPSGHIIVFDLKDISWKVIPKVNIMFFKDFLIFLLEAMPVRVKQVHVVNCPSYYDKLYSLVKPVLPAEICNIIQFHTNAEEGLSKSIDKKYLPKEYGGENPSMKEEQNNWVKKLVEKREFFMDETLWKADLSKKSKNTIVQQTMNGSFRSLSID